MKTLTVETSDKQFVEQKLGVAGSPYLLMVTPAIDENYWLFRVPLTDKQAIVGFPKFNTIGVGFQKEEDWNTNLPYSCSAEEIYHHIKCNKGDKKITKARCIEALKLLQKTIQERWETPEKKTNRERRQWEASAEHRSKVLCLGKSRI